jgi:hypothetical protein
MFVKIRAKPVDNVIVQVYMPTMDLDDNEIGNMYKYKIAIRA